MYLKSSIGKTILLCLAFASVLSAKPKPNKIRFHELPLAAFHEDPARTALWRYLLGTPHWDVREERGKRFACLKFVDSNSVYHSNGFIQNKKGEVQLKVLICFSGINRDKKFTPNILSNTTGSVLLPLGSSSLSSLPFQSYSLVGDSLLNISIFEASDSKNRKNTERIFMELKKELEDVLLHAYPLTEKGYWEKNPVGDSLLIEEEVPGYFKITGHYPFYEAGHIHLRIVSAQGNTLSGKLNRFNSSRPINWSGDSVSFAFQTYGTNAEIPPNKVVKGYFEVLFTNDAGKEVIIRKSSLQDISSFDRRDRTDPK